MWQRWWRRHATGGAVEGATARRAGTAVDACCYSRHCVVTAGREGPCPSRAAPRFASWGATVALDVAATHRG